MLTNIIRVLFSNVGITFVGLINSLLFPKIMEVNEYAYYQTYVLYLSYIGIMHLGLPTGMFIKYGGKSFKDIDKGIYKGEMRLLLFILSFFALATVFIGILFKNIIIVFVGLSIVPYDYVKSYLTLLQAWGDFKKYSKLNVFAPIVICTFASVIYVFTGDLKGIIYVWIYLSVYIILFFLILIDLVRLPKIPPIEREIITKDNLYTIKVGLTICIGNYISVLFHSVDKQFIKMFFDNIQFAMYSFAMSMQTIMTILITSLSQPMYFKLAASSMKETDYKMVKELLLVFGALSSCAFYACSIVVKGFIPKYIDSINIIANFFAIFPAMAVINCLYINLYKSRKMTRKYVQVLFIILLIAFALDCLVIIFKLDYIYLAVATVIAYYIWLLVGSFDFPELKLSIKDCMYLVCYFITYFIIVKYNFGGDLLGLFEGLIDSVILALCFYRKSLFELIKRLYKFSR